MKRVKKFTFQLAYDVEEEKLVALGSVRDKNGVVMKNACAIAISDPGQLFPQQLITLPTHIVVNAELIVTVPDAPKKGEVTLLKGKGKR